MAAAPSTVMLLDTSATSLELSLAALNGKKSTPIVFNSNHYPSVLKMNDKHRRNANSCQPTSVLVFATIANDIVN